MSTRSPRPSLLLLPLALLGLPGCDGTIFCTVP